MKPTKKSILFSLVAVVGFIMYAYWLYIPNHDKTEAEDQVALNSPHFNSPSTLSEKPPQRNLDLNHKQPTGDIVLKELPTIDFGKKLAEQLNSLYEQYNNGVYEAGYVLSLSLEKCHYAPKSRDELASRTGNIMNPPKELPFNNKDNIAAEITKQDQLFDYCEGVTSEQTFKYFSIMERLAQSNYPPAQAMYELLPQPVKPEDKFKPLTEWEKQQLAERNSNRKKWLKEAALSGSIQAMQQMIVNSNNNNVTALAYTLTILDFTSENHRYDYFNNLQFDLIDKMTAEEINNAREMSEQFIRTVRRNGYLYQ